MKILAIHGSMRKGNTYGLTKEILNRLASKPGVTVTEISVADLELPYCLSCHTCFSRGEEHCPHYGAMRGVEEAILECDGFIVSGASYMRALNAPMKNLMDHMSYWYHRPALFGKKGMAIVTSAGAGEHAVADYLIDVLGQWGVNGAVGVTRNARGAALAKPGKTTEKLDRAAERFYQEILSGRQIHPSINNIAVHNAFRAMSLSGYTDSECDTNYWRKEAMNKPYPVNAGPLKYAAGAIVFFAVKNLTNAVGKVYDKRKK